MPKFICNLKKAIKSLIQFSKFSDIIKKEKKYGLIWNNFDNLFTTRVESYIIKLYIKYKKII